MYTILIKACFHFALNESLCNYKGFFVLLLSSKWCALFVSPAAVERIISYVWKNITTVWLKEPAFFICCRVIPIKTVTVASLMQPRLQTAPVGRSFSVTRKTCKILLSWCAPLPYSKESDQTGWSVSFPDVSLWRYFGLIRFTGKSLMCIRMWILFPWNFPSGSNTCTL